MSSLRVTLLVCLAASASLGSGQSLSRGGALPDGTRYSAVEDTTLDSGAKDRPAGGSPVLSAGPGKVILIRFFDLADAVGEDRQISGATLILTALEGVPVAPAAVRVVKLPWFEGGLPPILPTPGIGGLGATWDRRRGGPGALEWTRGGAMGLGDAGDPLPGVDAEIAGSTLKLSGLGATFERMRSRWWENYGLALTFSRPVGFASSQAPTKRPVLQLETAPIPQLDSIAPDLSVGRVERIEESDGPSFRVHITNVGSAPSTGARVIWLVDGESRRVLNIPALTPAATTTLDWKPFGGASQLQAVTVVVEPDQADRNTGNNALEFHERAVPISCSLTLDETADMARVQRAIHRWNSIYLPHSRFSIAPDGATVRIRFQSVQQIATPIGTLDDRIAAAFGLPNLRRLTDFEVTGFGDDVRGARDPFGGLFAGDTRNESALPGRLALLAEPWPNSPTDAVPTEPTGLLPLTHIALLLRPAEARSWQLPRVNLLRVRNLLGSPLAKAELTFFAPVGGKVELGAPAFSLVTNAEGNALLPNRGTGPFTELKPDLADAALLVRAQLNGSVDFAWIKAWQLLDAASRGPGASFTEVRFNLPSVPIDASANLGLERVVRDSAGTAAERLAGLVDGNPDTAVSLPNEIGGWIEIELGRDRGIGEVLISADENFAESFEILGIATGQTVEQSSPMAVEIAWSWAHKNRARSGTVSYRTSGNRYRAIRIVRKGEGTGLLREVTLRGVER
jgi:hypothetical protein